MALNGISTLATKELRQLAKLDLASAKRVDENNPRAYYDINLLPTKYSGNEIVDNPHPDGLVEGRPWIAGAAEPSYTLEFRSLTGNGPEDWQPVDIITTCNEGDVISFLVIGVNVPDDENAYIEFGGANITDQDAQWPFSENFIGIIPYNVPGTVTNGAPILIEADNLTEGNETLTLSWVVNGETVATTSVLIVDTSVTQMEPQQLITNSNFTNGTTGWTASGGFGTYSETSNDKIALLNGQMYFTYVSRTLSRDVTVSSVTADASTFTAVVNLKHIDKTVSGYTQVDTYNFTVTYKNSSGGTVITKTTGTSNAPQNFTDITLTLNRSEIPSTFGTITSASISLTGVDTGSWNGNYGPVVRYITLTAS
jgi:hypothetical protein